MKQRLVWAVLFVVGGFAHACGGDDETAAPPPKVDAGSDANDASSDRGEPERDTAPSCTAPKQRCGSECADFTNDGRHCGGCGKDCGVAAVCSDGICVAPCGVDQARCLGQCVSPGTDNVNCGRCGERCADGLVCSAGTCRVECAASLGTCPPARAGDAGADAAADAGTDGAPPVRRYCADFASDERNCGGCGVRCAPGQECVNGRCDTSCSVGQTKCGASCFDLSVDLAHCGGCDHACGAGEVCSGATCQASCGLPFARCGNRCANFATDPENCGDCGRACGPEHVSAATCAAGQCGYTRCVPGFADCDGDPENGCEQAVSADPLNCGFCGNRCQPANAGGASCAGGACNYATCATGFDDCDGVRANGCEVLIAADRNNCGTCGKQCQATEVCSQARCVAVTVPQSLVFPGGFPGAYRRARATQYTVATVGPATIYYTLDGAVPTPADAATPVATTPFALPSVGTATIRWLAEYPGGSREPERTLTHLTLASEQTFFNHVSEHTDLNAHGPVDIVVGGATVNGHVDYDAWASDPFSGPCPQCVLHYVVYVDGVATPAGCIDLDVPPVFPGVSRVMNFSFSAPSAPGSYFVRAALARQFSCDGRLPESGEPIGMIVVQ